MYIKLNLQGELLELLQNESKEEFRSPTQQVMYILNKYYKDKLNSLKSNESVSNIPSMTTTYNEELNVTNSEYEEYKYNKEELVVGYGTQIEQQNKQGDYDYIDDDMIDF